MFDSQRSKICGTVNFRSHLLSTQQQQNRNGTMYTMCAPRMENSYPSGIWKQAPHMTTSARNFCSGQKIESPAAVNSLSNTMGNLKSTILPVYNSVKEFFTKFIKSSPEKPINEYNSEPNIYMNINNTIDDKNKKIDLKDFCEAPKTSSSVISLPKEEEMKEVNEEVIKKTETTLSEHKKRKNRKQKRILSQNKKKLNKSGQENNNSNKKKKSFNPENFHQKGKNMNKNKKEKNRHAIECSIHEDFDNNFLTKDCNTAEEITTPIFHTTKNNCFLVDAFKQVYSSAIPSVSSCKPQIISFTVEDFPTIQPSRQLQQNQSNYATDEWNFIKNNQTKNISRIRQYSECDSEDSFIVFSEESPKITPSYINNRPITLCQKFQKNFSPRQRNISECSDDSFVICFEDDPNRTADENFTYSSCSDSESDSETEAESVGHPPDSGFEEKKVNFLIICFFCFVYQKKKNQLFKCCCSCSYTQSV